jgi:hypothetical protein
LALIIYVGARLTNDWLTIWSAITAIGAFLALAALFVAAFYSREQYHATLEASRLETQRANDQIEADRQNTALVAASAQAQLEEAKSANKATQDFERVRLTREVIKEHTALTDRILKTFDTNWALTKSKNNALLAQGDSERLEMQNDAYIAISDCSALYAAGVLNNDIFMRRASLWILLAWYVYGTYLERNFIAGGARLEYVSLLVHGAARFVEGQQPQFFKNNPEIAKFPLPDPPPELGGYRP